MHEQIVMDRSGDTRHTFNPADAASIAAAEERFRELTGAGFVAAERTGPGETRVVRAFNPAAEATVFFPQLVGG